MSVTYVSTRNHKNKKSASEAILQGLAEDGGLFVPDSIPKLSIPVEKLKDMDYRDIAFCVMHSFFPDFTNKELIDCIEKAYDDKFDNPAIAPLSKAGGAYYIELYHGKTMAFKDMALSILPHLMTTAAEKNNLKDDIVILTATSGDTGKAALAGFSDVPGTKIVVFYPEKGVSPIQKHQMVTESGKNTCVIGIKGNFDQAQTGVKEMFSDNEMQLCLKEHGYRFSSANSINIGRLVPQIVYYVNTYARLVEHEEIQNGDSVNFVVPTGNFGNVLAAYYASLMGIPVNRLIVASNENKVLFDFFKSGTYDKNREFHVTNSPSMDILISSNLERLIYAATGNSDKETAKLMDSLKTDGVYDISESMKKELGIFYGNYATEQETVGKIKSLFDDTGYLIDTHTAVAAVAYDKYKAETGDKTVTAIASTASPYKFVRTVMSALTGKEIASDTDSAFCTDKDAYIDQYTDTVEYDFELCDKISVITGMEEPEPVKDLKGAKVIHKKVCEIGEMPAEVLGFLGIS